MNASDKAAIVIGGSAGALEALGAILPALPPSFPLPIALVLHVPPARSNHLAQVLAEHCALDVVEADDKQPLEPGAIYVAPPDYHMLIERTRTVALSADDPVRFSRPSIDVLFESASEAYGHSLVGLLLAGANDDGARGLAQIKAAGGLTVVQSPDSSGGGVTRTMPESALRLAPADHVLPLTEIGPFLARLGEPGISRKEIA